MYMQHQKNLFLVCLLAWLFAAAAGAEGAITVSLPEVSVDAGASITIPVVTTEVQRVFAVELTIEFNPGILSLETVKSTFLTEGFLLGHKVIAPGQVRISLASPRGFNGQGAFAMLVARVAEQVVPGTVSPLRLTRARLNGGAIPVARRDGSLIIRGATPVQPRASRCSITWASVKNR